MAQTDMSKDRATAHPGARVRAWLGRFPGLSVLAFGFIVFYAAYFCVLALVRPDATVRILSFGALNNAITAIAIAAVIQAVLRRFVVGRALGLQIAAHLLLAPASSLLWYAAVIIGIGLRNGSLEAGFSVMPFPSAALNWQIFQGFFLYAAAASLSYAIGFAQAAHAAAQTAQALRDRLEALDSVGVTRPARLLVKDGSEIVTVSLEEIIAARARDDQVEILTPTKRLATRQSLTQFADGLPDGFVRIHRSILINLDRVQSAEPAGDGRLSVHLQGGHSFVTSRAGARLIRERLS